MERVFRTSKPEILDMEAQVNRLKAQNEHQMQMTEIATARNNEMKVAIDVAEAEIAELSSKNANLLQTSRKNGILIEAYRKNLMSNSNPTEFLELQYDNDDSWIQYFWDEALEEKKNLLNEKTKLEMDKKRLNLKINGALEIKCKEQYRDQSQ